MSETCHSGQAASPKYDRGYWPKWYIRAIFPPCFASRPGSPGPVESHYALPTSHQPYQAQRAIGFRARMQTKNGRKMMNRKRRAGRSLNVADK